MRRVAAVVCGVLGVLAFGASAVPVFGADGGPVNAQVTVQAGPTACITVPATTVDFGTRQFSAPGNSSSAQAAPITVTGCANSSMTLFARGTNATGPSGSWTLTNEAMCPAAPVIDAYNLRLDVPQPGEVFFPIELTTIDSVVSPMGPDEAVSLHPAITMPCVGSSGAGQTMSMQYVFTATTG
jgi:hypothetical protein